MLVSDSQDWKAFPPRNGRKDLSKLRWKKGRPIVPGWENNTAKWSIYGLDAYNIPMLETIYPHATVFRGGIIPICNGKILMVKEKDRIVIDEEEYNENDDNVVRGFYGFAKGAVDHKVDKSILDTAIREFKEEVGVVICPNELCFPTIVHERPEVGEVLVFFPIIYKSSPNFNVDLNELDGAQWFTLGELQGMRKQMSNPTRAILNQLSNFTQLGT